MSWTCHEHVGAWRCPGSLDVEAKHGGEDPTGLSSAAVNACGGVIECPKQPTKGSDTEREEAFVQKRRDCARSDADEDKSDGDAIIVGISGKSKTGMGMLAKMKGRFGRRAGS